MYRGTTPTFIFNLPIKADSITELMVTFRQPGAKCIEKTLNDTTRFDQTVSVTLTETETLELKANRPTEIQLRAGVGESRMASQIFTVSVGRILKDGAL